MQSTLQSQRKAVGHKDGFGKDNDSRRRMPSVKETESGSGTRSKTPEGVPAMYRCPQGTRN